MSGKYAVPERIRAMKPKGTMVKAINGKYYVYLQKNEKGVDGKWHTKMGKVIGSIKEGIGFISNDNFIGAEKKSCYEYGQYALVYENTKEILEELKLFFNAEDATRIYLIGLIFAVEGYMPLSRIGKVFEQTYLSVKYPTLSFNRNGLSTFLSDLASRGKRKDDYQQYLLERATTMAIDGHCIESYSKDNDLSQYGNKYTETKEKQVNMLMAISLETGEPLYSEMFRGNIADKKSVLKMLDDHHLSKKLFIVDRGFYSTDTLNIFKKDGCNYIIPLSQNLNDYKKAWSEFKLGENFVYETKKTNNVVYYKETGGSNGTRVIVYKDMNRAAYEEQAFRKRIGSDAKYTEEKLIKLKPGFGAIVLNTSLDASFSCSDIFNLYKKRWTIENFFDNVKNRDGFTALCMSDYYVMQAMAFIALIEGKIETKFRKAIGKFKDKSMDDVLTEGRFVKILAKNDSFISMNYTKKTIQLFNDLNCPIVGELDFTT